MFFWMILLHAGALLCSACCFDLLVSELQASHPGEWHLAGRPRRVVFPDLRAVFSLSITLATIRLTRALMFSPGEWTRSKAITRRTLWVYRASAAAWAVGTVSGIVLIVALSPHTILGGLSPQRLIDELQQSLSVPLSAIVVSEHQLAPQTFQYRVVDEGQLSDFAAAAMQANTWGPSGHSGPIFECTFELVFEGGDSLRYLGSVNRYETEHLFLSDTFYSKSEQGMSRGVARVIRIPGMGQWIMNAAPDGRLGNQ